MKKTYNSSLTILAKSIIYLLFLLIAATNIYSQPYTFNHLSRDEGLSQNSVLSIQEDGQGFMWFGTQYGLNRFDSRTFKVYRHLPTDSTSISNDYILSSILDSRQNLWIGTINGLNKYNDKSDTFKHFYANNSKQDGLSNSTIHCLYEDRKGRLWIGTVNGLNLLVNEANSSFKNFLMDEKTAGSEGKDIRAITEDNMGNIWIGTTTGLYRISQKGDVFDTEIFLPNSQLSGAINDNFITSLAQDLSGNLWIGTKNGGLNLLENGSRTFQHFSQTGDSTTGPLHNYIRHIITDKAGRLWIGTLQGVSILNPVNKRFVGYQHDPEKSRTLSNNSVYSLFQDKAGSIYIGTYRGGVDVVYAQSTAFGQISSSGNSPGLNHNVISAIVQDAQDNLWIGTEGGGLNYFNSKTHTFEHYTDKSAPGKKISSSLIKCITIDKSGMVWVGTHLGGLHSIHPKSHIITSYRFSPGDIHSLSSDNVIDIMEDDEGKIWVGTDQHGINILDKKTGQFQRLNMNSGPIRLRNNMIRTLFQDSEKNIWIGTAEGVQILTKNKKDKWYHAKSPVDPKGLHASSVTTIFEDSKNRIWLASYYGGLSLYNASEESFTTYTQKDGLKNDNILGIMEDSKKRLWLGSDNGISCFDPITKHLWNYNTSDGMASNELTPGAFYKNRHGEMFFGSNQGLIHFFPDRIQTNLTAPKVVFTALKLFNKPVDIGDDTGILTSAMENMKSITFEYNQNIFTVEFAVLNFIKPRKNQYAYRLEGLETNWNIAETPSATYTNLSPGEYTLLVRGSNNDGIWSIYPQKLQIVVNPPIWRTWWAYTIYILISIIGIFLLARFFLMRALLQREHEMYQAKLDFFTNVSHEIRTHLTLILGPVEQILLRNTLHPKLLNDLIPVQKNGRRLLKLVNELMDFRKAETNHMHLQVSKHDLIPFLREIFTSFSHLSETHRIDYQFASDITNVDVYFDSEQLEKVIFNLLINAFKFTPDGGSVHMHVITEAKNVKIEVRDNGKGIAPDQLGKLFVNFFQVPEYGSQNTGYGIGLALSKSIMEQHKGSLTVQSIQAVDGKPGKTVFTILLQQGTAHLITSPTVSFTDLRPKPVSSSVLQQHIMETYPKDFDKTVYANQGKPSILLVEDNDDLRNFVEEVLSEHYEIIQSTNGKEGLELAFEAIPDLIISDVMMDQMDGLELCSILKSDPRSSHIPIILLTAKTATSQQIDGLKIGADAYITKPFHIELLELTIRNIFKAREVLREKFGRLVTLEPRQQVINTLDEKFIDDIIGLTEENMDNPKFGVNTLLKEIGTSRAILYKKLRVLTGMSVNEFIKSIRLKKAAQLLAQGHLTVNEISSSVGYEDRKYFRQAFKKHFGINPSEYNNIKLGDNHK